MIWRGKILIAFVVFCISVSEGCAIVSVLHTSTEPSNRHGACLSVTSFQCNTELTLLQLTNIDVPFSKMFMAMFK